MRYKYGMECYKCKQNKELKYFSTSYNLDKPLCINCGGDKEEDIPLKEIEIEIERIASVKEVIIKKERKNKKKRYNSEFKKKSRELLMKARNSTGCSECNSKELLQVHHIDKNNQNNSDENLVVLCYFCHSKYHPHMQKKKPPKWLK